MNARNVVVVVLLSTAVIGLLCAFGVAMRPRMAPIIVTPKGCPQSVSRAIWPQHYVVGQRIWRV